MRAPTNMAMPQLMPTRWPMPNSAKRSEEHTSELQSRLHLVCRLLLEKKIHSGQSFEVQIRTQDMHRVAEEGVAAHWKYKTGKPGAQDDDQRISWMRQLIEWSQEVQEPSEFLSTLKVDLAPVEVYAFTPKGRVLELPRGATPLDFAYMVHTEVGHQCVGAKINGQMVSLRHEIQS